MARPLRTFALVAAAFGLGHYVALSRLSPEPLAPVLCEPCLNILNNELKEFEIAGRITRELEELAALAS